jgi:hypothetical protein
MHLPRFLHYLNQASFPWRELQNLAREYWSVQPPQNPGSPPALTLRNSSRLRAFDKWVLTSSWPGSNIAVQHDSAEFLFWMINTVRSNAMNNLEPGEVAILDGLFTVTLRTMRVCPTCHRSTLHSSQDYNDGAQMLGGNTLSIQLNVGSHDHTDGVDYPRANTLDYYITRAFNESIMVRCSNDACNDATQPEGGRKRLITKIISAPEYLVLRLTTLENDARTGRYQKVHTPAGFKVPGTLDIAKHCSWNPSKYRYKLGSIVVHRGDNFNRGHYFGFFTAPGGSRYVSDAEVSNETLTSFMANYMTRDKDLPYIVVYKRV